jgi:hypothetical protein
MRCRGPLTPSERSFGESVVRRIQAARDASLASVLDALQRYAEAFDEVSDETGARYSAAAFVRWLKIEVSPPREAERHEPSRAVTG